MSYLDSLINHLSVEQASYLLQHEPIKSDFISLLNTILHNSPNTNLTSIAITILGRLGGRTRSTLKGTIDLPCLTESATAIVLQCNEEAGSGVVPFDYLLELVVQLFQRNVILDDLEGSVTKLSSSLRCPQENVVMMRGIRCSFKRNVLGVLRACLYLYCGHSAWVLSASTMRRVDAVLGEGAHWLLEHERCLALLLYALLLTQEDTEVAQEAKALMQQVIAYFAVLFLQYAQPNTQHVSLFPLSALPSQQQMHCEFLGPQLPPLPYCLCAPSTSASPLTFLHAVVSLLERDDDVCANTAMAIMQQLHEAIAEQPGEVSLFVAESVDEAFLALVVHRASEGNMKVRVSASDSLHRRSTR